MRRRYSPLPHLLPPFPIIIVSSETIRRLERDPIFANALVPLGDNKSRRCGETSLWPVGKGKSREKRKRKREEKYEKGREKNDIRENPELSYNDHL